MPSSYGEQYYPILVQVMLAMAIAAGMLITSAIVGHRVKNRIKDTPYECGITPVGTTRERFSVKFYLVAMMFILFDIETIFLYPWAVVYRELRMFAFFEMLVFVALVLCGFFYIWKKGALAWAYAEQRAPRAAPECDELRSSAGGPVQPEEAVGPAQRS